MEAQDMKTAIRQEAQETTLYQLRMIKRAALKLDDDVAKGLTPTEDIKRLAEATANLVSIIGGYGLTI